MRARVTVMLKDGVLDPQGRAIGHALAGLGFAGVGEVRAGKVIEMELAESDPARARGAGGGDGAAAARQHGDREFSGGDRGMRRAVAVAAFGLLALAGTAHAQRYSGVDGTRLLGICTNKNVGISRTCESYVAGVSDTVTLLSGDRAEIERDDEGADGDLRAAERRPGRSWWRRWWPGCAPTPPTARGRRLRSSIGCCTSGSGASEGRPAWRELGGTGFTRRNLTRR